MIKKEEKAIKYAAENHETFFCREIAKKSYEAGWDDALKSQWVDVKERLPKEWEDVIILFIKDGHLKVIKALYIGDERWVYGDASVERINGVIAWMPIPSFEDILEANKDVLKRLKDK